MQRKLERQSVSLAQGPSFVLGTKPRQDRSKEKNADMAVLKPYNVGLTAVRRSLTAIR